MVTTLPRVCYLGAYAADYPRNLILRRGLAHHCVEVVECRASTRLNTRQRAAALAPQFREVADRCNVLGTTAKAQRVAPNKAFQTLALGKPLISLGLREFFTPNEHLLTAPPGEPELLAKTILKLVSSHALREQLEKAGRARMEAAYTEAAVGRMLLDAIG